jgi:hypothetical protein
MPISKTVFEDHKTPTVEYGNLRPTIQNGDLLLCSGTAVFSKLIQDATKSIWSHVGFLMWLPTNPPRLMILESVESVGVRSVPLSSYLSDYGGSGKSYPGRILVARHSSVATHPLTPDFINFAVDRFGWPYATGDIVQIAAAIASHGALGDFQPDNAEKRTFICSEYVDACYQRIGIKVPWDRFGFIAPADFADATEINAIGILDTGWKPA